MGKKSTPKAPDPIDPQALIDAQAQFSLINQSTPFGSLGYTRGEDGSYTATQTLTPELQQLLDSQIRNTQGASDLMGSAQSRIGGLAGRNINAPNLQTTVGPNDFSADRSRVEQAFFDRTNNLLQPDFTQQEDRLRQSLADRGLAVGSEAFEDELSLMRRNQDMSRNQLALDSVLAGGGEQSRLFGMDLAQGQFGNDARTQQFGMDMSGRSQQFNELAALMGGQQVQVPGLSNFMAPGGVDAMGAYALQQQGLNNQYGAQMGQQNAKKGGATQLGAAGISALCSKKFKEEIGEGEMVNSDDVIDRLGNILLRLKKVSTDPRIKEIPVKLWRYIWDDRIHVSPYAEDFQRIFGLGDGKTIRLDHYAKVLREGVEAL